MGKCKSTTHLIFFGHDVDEESAGPLIKRTFYLFVVVGVKYVLHMIDTRMTITQSIQMRSLTVIGMCLSHLPRGVV